MAVLGAKFVAWSPYGKLLGCRVIDIEAGIRTLMESGGSVCLVAHQGNELVGGLVGIMSSVWFRPGLRVATELAWWVDPEHRGAVGVRLLRRFEAWAISQDAELIALSDLVVDGIEPADGMFRKLGYTAIERCHVREV